jgi:hypothetical protein
LIFAIGGCRILSGLHHLSSARNQGSVFLRLRLHPHESAGGAKDVSPARERWDSVAHTHKCRRGGRLPSKKLVFPHQSLPAPKKSGNSALMFLQ